MPAATRVTRSSPDDASVFEPPTGNVSSAGYSAGVASRVLRRYEMPSRSSIVVTSCTALLPSAGYSTVDPFSVRNCDRSSTAICEGPSSPIEIPACEPLIRRSARLIAPIRIWSAARVRNAPNVAANAVLPRACSPVCTPIMLCSAMYIWTNRSGATASTSSVYVELPTSPSRTTRSTSRRASHASASPTALRVAIGPS